MAEFDEIARRLAARATPLRVFFRDDDGGWANGRLTSLVHDFVDYGLALDIALIPEAMDEAAIDAVQTMIALAPELVHLHQHGYAHVDHERVGRASEFGRTRDFAAQLTDITRGQRRLRAAFGTRIEPIFTPPWNRCTNETVRALERAGLRILSRIEGSEALDTRTLSEIPVTLDWLKRRDGRRLDRTGFRDYALARVDAGDTLGVMLHHEHLDRAERERLGAFVSCLKRGGNVAFGSMASATVARTPPAGRDRPYSVGGRGVDRSRLTGTSLS